MAKPFNITTDINLNYDNKLPQETIAKGKTTIETNAFDTINIRG